MTKAQKEINFELLKKAIKHRTGALSVKNIRIVRRFEMCGNHYTEFLYDTSYETDQHCVYDDNWCMD